MRSFVRRIWPLPFVAALAVASPVQAGFVLMEDFQDVAAGSDLANANAGENFTSPTASKFSVVVDPSSAANLVLQTINATDAGVTAPLIAQVGGDSLAIADGTTATVFYRIRRIVTATPNFNTGLSDVATTATGDYESQLNVQTALAQFQVRDAGAFTITQRNYDADTWYGVFLVINTSTDTTQFYIQTDADPTPVLLTGGDNVYGFRNGTTSNALTNFLVRSTSGTHYVDDIYVDLAGENLTAPVPIPEPSVIGLGGVAALGLLRRRRRA